MNVGGCLLITIAAWSSVLASEASPQHIRSKRHILPLLGFLQGYKIGQDFALQLPPFVLSPIVILPSVNQQQSVNIHGSTEDNLDESGGTFQIIAPAKIIHHAKEIFNHEIDTNIDRTVTNETVLEAETNSDDEDTFRQNVIGIDNSTTSTKEPEKNNSITTITVSNNTLFTTETDLNATTTPYGPYPTAVYKNELVNNITFTEDPIETMIVLPSTQNNWQNFSSNKTKDNNFEEDLEARSDNAWVNFYSYPTKPTYFYKKPTYSLSYNNKDSSYISNSYGPDYSNHNRWQTYSSPGKYEMTSQFRPLAGLYYDGFLHQSPVKKTGFVPYNNNYYY